MTPEKSQDMDEETVHQQEIDDDAIVNVMHGQAETANDRSSIATACQKGKELPKEENQRWHSIQWRKLRSLIARDESVDPRNFPLYKKRLIMMQMMLAAIM